MTHKFNPFPRYSRTSHKSKVFQTVMLLIIITVCTMYIFYLSMYKTETDKVINDIKESVTIAPEPEMQIILPTKPEFVNLSFVELDLNTTEGNLKTVDSLENL